MKPLRTRLFFPRIKQLAAAIGISLGLSAPAVAMQFNAKVDHRGYVDVWAFRKDLSTFGQLPLLDVGECGEEDGEAGGARQERRSSCLARVRALRHRRGAFNAAWLPALLGAAKKGDPVAEVILLRCDTTPLLDRTRYPSTCSGDRKHAVRRLREIGFVPAIPLESEPGFCDPGRCDEPAPNSAEIMQAIVLRAFRHGNFGPTPYEAIRFFGEPRNDPALQYRIARNAALIEAARQEVRRAFMYSGSSYGDLYGTVASQKPRSKPPTLISTEAEDETGILDVSKARFFDLFGAAVRVRILVGRLG